jgi:anti-sigma factor ChrR (cupin superfamily)
MTDGDPHAHDADLPTCRDVVEMLVDLGEGALTEERVQAVAYHLKLCPPCSEVAATYEALPRVVRTALEHEMPQDAKRRLQDAIAARFCRR